MTHDRSRSDRPELPAIGEFEQLVLLAVLQVRDDAYGVTVHEELERHTTRPVARGAVYMTLDRLEKKGLLTSSLSEPTAERGGRAKRCYALTKTAILALRDSRRTLQSLWNGLEPVLGK
ncbi:MAG TPA: helix-turn-helix transcriptional regulator [Vicinamibacterales bacterium]|nr:helix-turn-helix transcriptional regulator [Vicinamibacterales bacterium]